MSRESINISPPVWVYIQHKDVTKRVCYFWGNLWSLCSHRTHHATVVGTAVIVDIKTRLYLFFSAVADSAFDVQRNEKILFYSLSGFSAGTAICWWRRYPETPSVRPTHCYTLLRLSWPISFLTFRSSWPFKVWRADEYVTYVLFYGNWRKSVCVYLYLYVNVCIDFLELLCFYICTYVNAKVQNS